MSFVPDLSTVEGPNSMNKPVKDEQPGPFSNEHSKTDATRTRTSIQPKHNRVVFGIISTLKEPEEKMFFIIGVQVSGILMNSLIHNISYQAYLLHIINAKALRFLDPQRVPRKSFT